MTVLLGCPVSAVTGAAGLTAPATRPLPATNQVAAHLPLTVTRVPHDYVSRLPSVRCDQVRRGTVSRHGQGELVIASVVRPHLRPPDVRRVRRCREPALRKEQAHPQPLPTPTTGVTP